MDLFPRAMAVNKSSSLVSFSMGLIKMLQTGLEISQENHSCFRLQSKATMSGLETTEEQNTRSMRKATKLSN